MGMVLSFDARRRHGRASSGSRRDGASTIPHRDAGAAKPAARRASCITTNVSAGNLTKPFQLKAAPYLRPVKLATLVTPPRASITSTVVDSSQGCVFMDSLNNPNFLDTQYPNIIGTKKFGYAAACLTMAEAGTDTDEDTALRCRVVTLLYGKGNSTRFAEEDLGVGYKAWNHAENTGDLSRPMARVLTQKYPDISLDWLYRGRDIGLTTVRSEELAAAFRRVEAKVNAKRLRRETPKKRRRA